MAVKQQLNTSSPSEGSAVVSKRWLSTNETSPTRAGEMRVGHPGICGIHFLSPGKGIVYSFKIELYSHLPLDHSS